MDENKNTFVSLYGVGECSKLIEKKTAEAVEALAWNLKNKQRLDVLLVERGLAETRSKAQAIILSGEVYADGRKADKAGEELGPETVLEVRGSVCPYVSRGGWKLEKALADFGVDPTGFVCSDSGASTGGFTDCLLQKGAAKVFAIDVGYGQLAWKIRSDERVVVMLTFLPLGQIDEMDRWEGSQLNRAKEILAYELTALVHGEEEAKKAEAASKALFAGGSDDEHMPFASFFYSIPDFWPYSITRYVIINGASFPLTP